MRADTFLFSNAQAAGHRRQWETHSWLEAEGWESALDFINCDSLSWFAELYTAQGLSSSPPVQAAFVYASQQLRHEEWGWGARLMSLPWLPPDTTPSLWQLHCAGSHLLLCQTWKLWMASQMIWSAKACRWSQSIEFDRDAMLVWFPKMQLPLEACLAIGVWWVSLKRQH